MDLTMLKLVRISHHDSSSWMDGPPLCCELRGLVAPASRWRFVRLHRGAKQPARRRRHHPRSLNKIEMGAESARHLLCEIQDSPPPAGRKHPIENAFQWRSGLPARRRYKRKKRVYIVKKAINLSHE